MLLPIHLLEGHKLGEYLKEEAGLLHGFQPFVRVPRQHDQIELVFDPFHGRFFDERSVDLYGVLESGVKDEAT